LNKFTYAWFLLIVGIGLLGFGVYLIFDIGWACIVIGIIAGLIGLFGVDLDYGEASRKETNS
jgi:hypothetical protein